MLSGKSLTSLYLRPIFTSTTGNADIIFVKGGMFRKGGFDLNTPFKEQFFRRAETWEKPYIPEKEVLM